MLVEDGTDNRKFTIYDNKTGFRFLIYDDETYTQVIKRMLEAGVQIADQRPIMEIHEVSADSLNAFRDLWRGGKSGRYALLRVELDDLDFLKNVPPYLIFDIWSATSIGIENNDMHVAVVQRMLKAGVRVFNKTPKIDFWFKIKHFLGIRA